jgi:hypothetical protein
MLEGPDPLDGDQSGEPANGHSVSLRSQHQTLPDADVEV